MVEASNPYPEENVNSEVIESVSHDTTKISNPVKYKKAIPKLKLN